MKTLPINDHWVLCDRTGFKIPASETVKEWNGLRVRAKSYEKRHSQDFVRGKKDVQTVRDPRVESVDAFLSTNEVTAEDL